MLNRSRAPNRHRHSLWALAGALLGALAGALVFAPAAWLAQGVQSASHGRLLLADAQGTVWQGHALMVLTGGPGSRDAAVLPSRLEWRLGVSSQGLKLGLAQACCIAPEVSLTLAPGWGQWRVNIQTGASKEIGQWPAGWLEGLGAPLNTLRPAGHLRLSAHDASVVRKGQGAALGGRLELDLLQTSSRLSTLDPLGSYRLTLTGDAQGSTLVNLLTLEGALQLSGQGQVDAKGLHLRGEARASSGQEAALNNLLNIIGRRTGAVSVLSIG
ncbi:MAG: general secretion pathway protein GspN [Ideonella sp. MAG2]|nr:MAG: general secretion pathway protein GspN [Ideonella sp. MAG2]